MQTNKPQTTRTQTTSIQFKAGTLVELSFATVIEGKEKQLFGEYFPKVIPIVNELGGKPMGSFAVGASASKLGTPKMGAFFQWQDLDGFHKLHTDPRFLAIKGIRDEALSFFSNAHFFNVDQDCEVTFEEGQTYALVAEWNTPEVDMQNEHTSMVRLTLVQGASDAGYRPKHIRIIQWNENSARALEMAKAGKEGTPEVFKFVMNMPA